MSNVTYSYRIRVSFRNQLGTAQIIESKFMTEHPSIDEVIDYIRTRLTHGDKLTGLSIIRYVIKEEGEVQPDGTAK